MIEAFCAAIPVSDLPFISNHQVTEAELKAMSELISPYFVGLGPIEENASANAIRREVRRRTRLITPVVRKEAHEQLQKHTTENGELVAGWLLTTFFITYVLPSLVAWVIEKMIAWLISQNWQATTVAVIPLSCNISNESSNE